MADVRCAECGGKARRVTGADIYGHRRDLHYKVMWRCDCGAYVGCHPGTNTALGTCAGPKLRNAREYVHSVLDPHWRSGQASRDEVYAYLRAQMGLTPATCHVAMFTYEQCRQAYRIMKAARFERKPLETNG